MTILIGHPTGTPFSHHAALAYWEQGLLESFCVPWMPSLATLRLLATIQPLRPMVRRFSRRYFPALGEAPKIQGRLAEVRRLTLRALGYNADPFTREANDWLMRIMARECGRSAVTAIHAYEDCSLLQFEKAKRHGKACIYDMPIAYHAKWESIEAALLAKYRDWLPRAEVSRPANRQRKVAEMELADLVLAPSQFVADTIHEFYPGKKIALAPYGIDLTQWPAPRQGGAQDELAFLFVGHCSLRKGVPLLIEAWRAANVRGARLDLVGAWQLTEDKKRNLPPGCSWHGPVSVSDPMCSSFRATSKGGLWS
jgi:glycosyltransferase involved in cell wall biosynthesis